MYDLQQCLLQLRCMICNINWISAEQTKTDLFCLNTYYSLKSTCSFACTINLCQHMRLLRCMKHFQAFHDWDNEIVEFSLEKTCKEIVICIESSWASMLDSVQNLSTIFQCVSSRLSWCSKSFLQRFNQYFFATKVWVLNEDSLIKLFSAQTSLWRLCELSILNISNVEKTTSSAKIQCFKITFASCVDKFLIMTSNFNNKLFFIFVIDNCWASLDSRNKFSIYKLQFVWKFSDVLWFEEECEFMIKIIRTFNVKNKWLTSRERCKLTSRRRYSSTLSSKSAQCQNKICFESFIFWINKTNHFKESTFSSRTWLSMMILMIVLVRIIE